MKRLVRPRTSDGTDVAPTVRVVSGFEARALVAMMALPLVVGALSACSTTTRRPATLQPVLPETGLVEEDLQGRGEIAHEGSEHREAVRSVSLGRPNAGALKSAVQMPEDPRWELVVPQHAWGTEETVKGIARAVESVHDVHGDAHPLHIGDLSRRFGGPLYPHRSHQSGRDVDLGYYYLPGKAAWYQRASKRTLDVARTWTLVRALITRSDVEYIFIDRAVQKLLRDHALSLGEDKEWLATVFQYKSIQPGAIVRHTWGHATHMHVRFYSPKAQRRGQEMYAELTKKRLLRARTHFSEHTVQEGDTLTDLALAYGTPVHRIVRANRLRGNQLEPGTTVKVPRRGRIAPVMAVHVPPRPIPGRQATTPRRVLAAEDH